MTSLATQLAIHGHPDECYARVNDRAVNALIEPLGAEDRLLFARAYREHYTALLSFVRRRVDTDAEAADLVQEAYLRVLRYRNRAADQQDSSTLKALLYQIAVNLLVERVRVARAQHQLDHIPLEDTLVIVAPIPAHDRQVAGEQDLSRLLAIIKKLPRKRREVFLLRRFQGLSYREIGERLGMSTAAVERNVTRAMAFCRKELFGEGGFGRF